ncbi:thioredoxin family protein [Candidatus Peregrinibacteria bacterium]|nr:thioredoxin family protein [Candidatus Peregrinibacteria bacterium]
MVLINDNSSALSIGDAMPSFTLPSVDDSMVDSATLSADVLVVIFTCNHCPYAQAYEDRIVELAKKFQAKGVQFILVNSNDATNYPDDSFENMKLRAKEKGYFFPYCVDETQEVAKAYGALCTPHCFVFDHDRKLRYKGRVDDNWKEPSGVKEHNLHDAIASLIEGKTPPTSEANAIGCSIKWKS